MKLSSNFSVNGKCNIVRRGNAVTISTVAFVSVGEGCSLSNKLPLPQWAIPSKALLIDGELRSSVAEDMNGNARTQIVINAEKEIISLFTFNKSELNNATVYNNITYLVD